MKSFIIKVNELYDNEVEEALRLNVEAELAQSNYLKLYEREKFFEYYKITSSIKRIKKLINNYLNS